MKLDYYLLNTYVPALDGPAPLLYEKFLEQVEAADALGFDTAWLTEHHFRPFGGMLPNAAVLLAALAQRTRRIRLGPAVIVFPLQHPLRIAEDVAMLDLLSQGRIDLGAGRGMATAEYEVFGADAATADARMHEQLELVQAAWTQRPFTWQGQFYQFPTPLDVWPPPVQQPHPPIWVTANVNAEHFRWIGQHGYNLMTLPWILLDLEQSRALIDVYRAALVEAGYDPSTRDILAMFPVYCGESPAAARREAEPYWLNWRQVAIDEVAGVPGREERWRRLTYDVMVDETRAIFGDPAMCQRALLRLRDALGLTHVAGVFHFGGMPQEQVLASMRRYATEVAPRIRAEGRAALAGAAE